MTALCVGVVGTGDNDHDFIAVGPFARNIQAMDWFMSTVEANPGIMNKLGGEWVVWVIVDDELCDYSPDAFQDYLRQYTEES
jgi:hypothetical protein